MRLSIHLAPYTPEKLIHVAKSGWGACRVTETTASRHLAAHVRASEASVGTRDEEYTQNQVMRETVWCSIFVLDFAGGSSLIKAHDIGVRIQATGCGGFGRLAHRVAALRTVQGPQRWQGVCYTSHILIRTNKVWLNNTKQGCIDI